MALILRKEPGMALPQRKAPQRPLGKAKKKTAKVAEKVDEPSGKTKRKRKS